MEEVKVGKNTGETAEFSDGGLINRQRPGVSTAQGVNYTKILQPQQFKYVLAVGLTKEEVNTRLLNPGSSDGLPIGRLMHDTKIPARSGFQYPEDATADDFRAVAAEYIKKADELENGGL